MDNVSIGRNLVAPRRRGARRWLVIASVALHAGVIGTYVVTGMMRIERLHPERTQIRVAALPKMDLGSPTENPGVKPKEQQAKPKPRPPAEVTQPPPVTAIIDDQPTPDPAEVGGGDPDVDGPPGDGGTVKGIPTGQPPGCPPGQDCTQTTPTTPTTKKPDVTAPINVPPSVIGALRTAGDPQIHPDNTTQTAMIRDGAAKVVGIVQLCLDTTGRVARTKVLRSTGYAAYDRELQAGVQSWRYQPHLVNGTAVPVCSTVHFNYSIK